MVLASSLDLTLFKRRWVFWTSWLFCLSDSLLKIFSQKWRKKCHPTLHLVLSPSYKNAKVTPWKSLFFFSDDSHPPSEFLACVSWNNDDNGSPSHVYIVIYFRQDVQWSQVALSPVLSHPRPWAIMNLQKHCKINPRACWVENKFRLYTLLHIFVVILRVQTRCPWTDAFVASVGQRSKPSLSLLRFHLSSIMNGIDYFRALKPGGFV